MILMTAVFERLILYHLHQIIPNCSAVTVDRSCHLYGRGHVICMDDEVMSFVQTRSCHLYGRGHVICMDEVKSFVWMTDAEARNSTA